MASAAAVAADEANSPLSNDLGEDSGRTGEITSGIYAKDEELPDVNGASDDEDEDLPSNPLKRRKQANGDARAQEEDDEEDGDDLFGDEEEPEPTVRQLDDEELDSGDDEDRMDRVGDEQEQEEEYVTMDKITMDLEIPRQPNPEPSDGEMYLLKVPDFMTIEPHAWDHTTFQPPTTDHHSKKAPSSTFSAYNTALTTIRWRHSPSHPSQLQSNARINRWSNGALTLQLASDPTIQYEIDANTLVPPQRNPIKPTPTSIQTTTQKAGRHGTEPSDRYDQRQDAFTYLFRPHEDSSTLIVTNKITAGLSIKQSANVEDDAIERLQASLAAANNVSKVNGVGGLNLIQIDEDPEQAKLQAIQAAKEKERRDKRHQAAMDREAAKVSSRLHGRSGGRHLGLNVGMLEDDEMGEGTGRPSPHSKARAKPRRRRNSEYSEDEDFGRKRFSREDEYDEEDDFLAPSDEEEVIEDDDDPDDGILEEDFVEGGRRRERTPKREREVETGDEDGDADAPGEDDDEVQQSRTKRRRVVDDEDEDE